MWGSLAKGPLTRKLTKHWQSIDQGMPSGDARMCRVDDKILFQTMAMRASVAKTGIEVPWTWERESWGQKRKRLKKVFRGRGPKVRKKVSKKIGKVPQRTIFRLLVRRFRNLFEIFFRLLGPGSGRLFRAFFGDFLAFGPETPSPRSTQPQDRHDVAALCKTTCDSDASYSKA